MSIIFAGLIASLFFTAGVCANDLDLSNGTVVQVDDIAGTATVQFTVKWDNSWRDSVNHDAVWLFLKYSVDSGKTWKHATIAASGTNPSGFSEGTGMNMELVVPEDRKGCFLRRSWTGTGEVISENVTLKWGYKTDGLSQENINNSDIKIFGIEMVFIPTGSFYLGDYEVSTACFSQGKDLAETDPWYVQSESAIFVMNADANGFYYRSAGNIGENATGSEFTISDSFPKGFKAIYVMKYEITEEQWVDFFNMLTDQQKNNRDITGPLGKNTDSTVNRNTVSIPGDIAATYRPNRACGYLSWMDIAAYADWAALRPISELEFEKIARGKDITPIGGEYAWGTTGITTAAVLSGPEDGSELVVTSGANVCFGNSTFSGGDGGLGPVRAGIFARSGTSRTQAGSSYYGVMEMSGNLWERVITVGNSAGRGFQGTHGDGMLSEDPGYEGNATIEDWPGYAHGQGVSGSLGVGIRGGSYAETSTSLLSVSDRSRAVDGNSVRSADTGGRCARTAP